MLSADPTECEEMLDFVNGPIVSEWSSVQEWLSAVPGQRTRMYMDLVFALVEGTWTPVSFSTEPAEVPCGRGESVTEATWGGLTLAAAGLERRDPLYTSISMELLGEDQVHVGERVLIKLYQDNNCDGDVAVSEIEAVFRKGDVFGGGWTLVSSDYAPVHH